MTPRQNLETAIENLVAAEINYVAWAARPDCPLDGVKMFTFASEAWEKLVPLLDKLENCHECR